MIQLIRPSAAFEPVALTAPTSRAIPPLTKEAVSPTVILTDNPFKVRRNKSLPRASVPKGCAGQGGHPASKKLPARACSGINIPQRQTAARTAAIPMIRITALVRPLTFFIFNLISLLPESEGQ